jgi:hypothetical protein
MFAVCDGWARPHRYASKLACEALRAGMQGIDNLYSENLQAEHGIRLANPCAKIISANLFSKVKQTFASAFAPAYASVLA